MYYRYMDDTFVVFDNERECDLFLEQLNSLHTFLQFTFEKECNESFPFLDVMVENPRQNLSPLSTENLLSLTNTFVGILSALKNGKPIQSRLSPIVLCLFVHSKSCKMN